MLNLNILLELCLQTSVLFILLCFFFFFYTYFGVYFQLIIIIIMVPCTPLIIRRDVSDLDLQLSGMSSSKLSTGTSSPVSSQQERFSLPPLS